MNAVSEFSSRAKYRGAQGTAQSASGDSGALSFGSVFLDAPRVLWASKENEHAASARKIIKQPNSQLRNFREFYVGVRKLTPTYGLKVQSCAQNNRIPIIPFIYSSTNSDFGSDVKQAGNAIAVVIIVIKFV